MSETVSARAKPVWLPFVLDYGPLLLFFLLFRLRGVFVGTAGFMLAIVLAVVVSRIRLGRVSPMLWLSAILVVGFGGLTLYFHDERIIQHKPTAVYILLSVLLFGGLLAGKPLLKYLLEAGYENLSERGWMLLSRNWAFFFLVMAALNEVLVAKLDFGQWLTVKVWLVSALSLLFGVLNIPLLLRHTTAPPADEPEVIVPPQG